MFDPLFADTEIAENHVKNVLDIDAASHPAQRPGGQAQLLGDQIVFADQIIAQSPTESLLGIRQRMAVAFAADQSLLSAGEVAFGIARQGTQKVVKALT